jgi:hypothetical protein
LYNKAFSSFILTNIRVKETNNMVNNNTRRLVGGYYYFVTFFAFVADFDYTAVPLAEFVVNVDLPCQQVVAFAVQLVGKFVLPVDSLSVKQKFQNLLERFLNRLMSAELD